MGERIGFIFLALLLTAALLLCFFINLYLGVAVFAFSAGVLIWILRVRKKKVDSTMQELAKHTGLSFSSHPLRYGKVWGNYRGLEVEISVCSGSEARAGLGPLLTSLTGSAAFSTLDIHNLTRIRIFHTLSPESKLIIQQMPLIILDQKELTLFLPYVSTSSAELKTLLNHLHHISQLLSQENL